MSKSYEPAAPARVRVIQSRTRAKLTKSITPSIAPDLQPASWSKPEPMIPPEPDHKPSHESSSARQEAIAQSGAAVQRIHERPDHPASEGEGFQPCAHRRLENHGDHDPKSHADSDRRRCRLSMVTLAHLTLPVVHQRIPDGPSGRSDPSIEQGAADPVSDRRKRGRSPANVWRRRGDDRAWLAEDPAYPETCEAPDAATR